MKVKETTMYKVVILVVFILVLDCTTHINNSFQNKINTQQKTIEQLEAEIDNNDNRMNDIIVEYENSLKRVVSNLYEEELFIEKGGAGIAVENYDIDKIYEVIMNGSQSFSEFLNDVENYFDARKEYVNDIPSIWPIEYSPLARITDGFGYRIYPFTGTLEFHKGIDIAAEWNTKILATADGVVKTHYLPPGEYNGVEFIGDRVYGGYIVIEHANGYETGYAHMSRTYVKEEMVVERGDVIGIIGNTGKSRGIHLHYEVKKDGELINPIDFLSSNGVTFMNRQSVDLN